MTLAASSVTAPAEAHETGYYVVEYSDQLLHDLHDPSEDFSTIHAGYEVWQREEFPAPQPAPVRYVKRPWFPSASAVHADADAAVTVEASHRSPSTYQKDES